MISCFCAAASKPGIVVVGGGGSSSRGYDTVETTETVFETTLATYTKPLIGLIATPYGLPPTGIVATTVLFAGFITETVFESALVT